MWSYRIQPQTHMIILTSNGMYPAIEDTNTNDPPLKDEKLLPIQTHQ